MNCSVKKETLPEYLKWGKYSRNYVPSIRKDLHGSEGDLDGPRKTQDHVFYNGTIVVCLKKKTETGQLIVHDLHREQTSSGLQEDTEFAAQPLEK